MIRQLFIFFVITTLCSSVFAQTTSFEIPAIFSSNMVLQQKTKVPFWGKALPGTKIWVKASWKATAQTETGTDSTWRTSLQTPSAGGPYQVTIKIGDTTVTYKHVLVGEVWLCSGQSNMEMPMEGWPPKDTIWGAQEEIKNGASNNLRFFTVKRAFADSPQFDCSGEWQVSSPEAVAQFSATAFYFGKKLAKELKIPVGLIHSSWGGTPIEAWTNKKYLGQVQEFKDIVKKLDNAGEERKRLEDWLAQFSTLDMRGADESKWQHLSFRDLGCAAYNYNDSQWRIMHLPTLWEETEVGNFDGAVWFRKKVSLPEHWLHKELTLELGPIDDMDETFVNGKKIGEHESSNWWDKDRVYDVSSDLVRSSTMVIAVRVIDNQGGGGIYGDKNKLKLVLKETGESIPLAGEWKYLPTAEYRQGRFYIFGGKAEIEYTRPWLSVDLSPYMPTALYNGMITPLVPFAIKGAIWYQGESNTAKPELYRTLLPNMIENWRGEWNEGEFPFYFVQIAPFNYGDNTRSQLLREAQMMALKVPHTGMAVTLDIGNPDNVHPGDKKDVGERLARWALAKDYKKKEIFSGPLYKSMEVNGDKLILSFDYAEKGLILKPKDGGAEFLLAGENKIFKTAKAVVSGKQLILTAEGIEHPAAARYAWDNTSSGILFNSANLPASSFRTDDWNE